MQTPKAKASSSEVLQRKSPRTPRTARQLKTPGSGSDSVSTSPLAACKTPKERSPRVVTDRKSPRSLATQSKGPSKVAELESQLSQLQEELKKTSDQLSTSESHKKQVQQEAEEAKKQLSDMSTKLEESQQQVLELSASEEDRVQELHKVSQDRDRAWQSELEAVQKQHAMDAAALSSAMNEVQRLKVQLDMVSESEETRSKLDESTQAEIDCLRTQLSETLSLVEKLKNELSYCRECEAEALDIARKNQNQFETAKAAVAKLQSDGIKAIEAYNSLSLELEQSKAQIQSLEGQISNIQIGLLDSTGKDLDPAFNQDEINEIKTELTAMRLEANKSKSALDAVEARYEEESIRTALQIRIAHELVEQIKVESCQKEEEFDAKLDESRQNIEQLRVNLKEKETQLCSVLEENKRLNLEMSKSISVNRESELTMELRKLEADMEELKTKLVDKETELQSTSEENQAIKIEIEKMEMERNKINDEAVLLAETNKAAEQELLMKLEQALEEADKSSQRAARVAEQLDAAQAANSEMEAELRRLKVQTDQWRKAAEAAAAILSTGNNGKFVDRLVSLENSYPLGSPYSEDLEDESPKKKNGNVLKKIGVLWKKNQK